MNLRKWLTAPGLCCAGVLALGLSLTPAPAPAAGPSPAPAQPKEASDTQDVVFLGEARPVLVRLHVRVDGKPVQVAWEGFMQSLFAHLDVNADGSLSKDEVERAPTVDQLTSGGIAVGGGGFGGGRPATAAPSMEAIDTDKDGKVTLAELSAYYKKSGLAPFQFQLSAPQDPFAAVAFLGGGRAEPSVSEVSEAIFKLLDAGGDGKLTREKLAAAPAVLLRLDEDEDEIVTTRELVPNAKTQLDALIGGGMMANPGQGGAAPANKYVVPVTVPGQVPEKLVRFMQERYGAKSDNPEGKKLARKDLGLDEKTFAALDANKDGVLDADELGAFIKLRPDLVLTMRLGQGVDKRVEVGAKGSAKSPLADKVKTADAVALLDLGVTRLDLRTGVKEDDADYFGMIIRQQATAQFKQADTNGDGVLDAEEAKKSRGFGAVFKAMDRDGDGKVTEKEFNAYLDKMQELQKQAQAACVCLVFADQSRGLFDMLDTNRDGRLSVREMRNAVNILAQLDTEGKGYLTKADIPRSYRLTLRPGPAAAGIGGNAIARLYRGNYSSEPELPATGGPEWFRKMDRNRDGDVSRKEFLFGDEAFRRIDTDGDGLISREEAEKADALMRQKGKP